MDERVGDRFGVPGGELDAAMYAYSLFVVPPDAMSHQPTVATGTVMRPDTLRGYAREAGFEDLTVLIEEFGAFRFYELVGQAPQGDARRTDGAAGSSGILRACPMRSHRSRPADARTPPPTGTRPSPSSRARESRCTLAVDDLAHLARSAWLLSRVPECLQLSEEAFRRYLVEDRVDRRGDECARALARNGSPAAK